MSRRRDQPSTAQLLLRLPQQIVALAKIEYENAKREIVRKAKNAGIGVGSIIIALFFVFFMLQALVMAAIAGLAVVWPWWLASLVVAAGLLLLAALAVLAGIFLIKRGNPVPEETLERVGDDVSAFGDLSINSDVDPGRGRSGHANGGSVR